MAITKTVHHQSDRAVPTSSVEDLSLARREAAFAGARRHSRMVRLFKVMLPALGVLLGGGFLAYSYLLSPSGFSVDISESGISDGKLVMANPTMNGYTADDLPYSMKASRAIQDLSMTGAITLEEIDAKLPLSGGTWAFVTAAGGIYDDTGNTLDINTPVTFKTSDGMVANFQSAFLDIQSGELTTSDPVEIVQGGSRITADKFRVLEKGDVFLFEDRVRMKIDPSEMKTASTSKSAGESGN